MDQADRPPAPDQEPGRLGHPLGRLDPHREGRRRRRLTFRFVQFEFPWSLGPPDGRYVVRAQAEDTPDHVLVLRTLGAPERRLLTRRRPRSTPPEPPPTPVPTARVTIIDARSDEDPATASRWLTGADREAVVTSALEVLNRALHHQRIAAADPLAREVGLTQALVVRIGYGDGEQVADGRWTEALTLPGDRERRSPRNAALRHQERFAALLGAREHALACEEMTLRARLDLDRDRLRECALELDRAVELALVELRGPGAPDLERRVAELEGQRAPIGELARAALSDGVQADGREILAHTLGRLEALLRARSAAGTGPGGG